MPTRRALFLPLSLSACASRSHRLSTPSLLNRRAPDHYRARFLTTRGAFDIHVTRAWAPLAADRFFNLTANGFYNGHRFFRVLPNYIVQWGLHPDPNISKSWGAATRFPDDPVTQSNRKATVSFASAGPNTRTTSLFINLKDNPHLDPLGFAPFGIIHPPGLAICSQLYSAYGEAAPRGKGPDQSKIRSLGEPYLAREFPHLDRILRASILLPQPWQTLSAPFR